jgi:hypothetical protein
VPPERVADAVAELTVITVEVVAEPQPLVTVYEITVVPEASALTTPAEETVATAGVVLLHEPPPTVLLSTVYEPVHIAPPPDREPADGRALTTTFEVAVAEPHALVTV